MTGIIHTPEFTDWEEARNQLLKRDAWMDDLEADGGWMYAPDFLGLLVEVFSLLFPEKRHILYEAYIYWNRMHDIPPGTSTLKHGISRRAHLEMVQKYLTNPTEGFDAFVDWCKKDTTGRKTV